MLERLPIFGICGVSGAGKTTLIEGLLSHLIPRGLRVGILKRDVHGLTLDTPGKDSDRFFKAGANVVVGAPTEVLARIHCADGSEADQKLNELAACHDLVLVEGFRQAPWKKVWLRGRDDAASEPAGTPNVAAVLPRDDTRLSLTLPIVEQFLHDQWRRTPVLGCVLIGGRSSRMGTPKHLLPAQGANGLTLLEKTVNVLSPFCEQVIVVGRGQLPPGIAGLGRLADAPDTQGPLAGVLAALRWGTGRSWLVAACDLPHLTEAAMEWLLSTRQPGIWASLPRLNGVEQAEPLLAHYDFRMRSIVELLAASPKASLQDLSRHPKSAVVPVPEHLAHVWQDMDTPDCPVLLSERGSQPRHYHQ
jgi:molybdopterin-guanine dinucleotide biosynthesis protein MobB